MASDDKYITVYTGLEVNVQHLQNLFKEAKIGFFVRNNFESGRLAGFGGGFIDQVQLQVHERDVDKALKIVKATFPEEKEEE